MIIIDENTDLKLMQHFEKLRTDPLSWRCTHLHLQSVAPDKRTEVTEMIVSRIGGFDHYAYVDSKGDVFLLGRDILVRELRKVTHMLGQQLGFSIMDPLSDFYELSSGWGRLAYLIETRLELIIFQERAEKEKAFAAKQARDRAAIINVPVDAALVESIAARRTKHARPEVLIVEDEPFSGRLVENAINAKNSVLLVDDGQSAIINYARRAPHVLFLDIDLPDINGFDVIHRVLSMDPQAYIIMLSGNADHAHIMKAMQAGAKGFVGKPFTRDKLNQYIERCPGIKSITTGGTI